MAIPHSDKLVARAKTGERLSTKERRHAVTYLMATEPDATNVGLGELFQVSERTIRDDKVWIREERARFIKEDDISLVIADIALNFDRQMRDIESAKRSKECKPGTRTYLEYCKALFNMELQKVEALQSLGYYPKDLGKMTVQKYEYTASVAVMTAGEAHQLASSREKQEDALDAEFSAVDDGDLKLLPAPEDTAVDTTQQAS